MPSTAHTGRPAPRPERSIASRASACRTAHRSAGSSTTWRSAGPPGTAGPIAPVWRAWVTKSRSTAKVIGPDVSRRESSGRAPSRSSTRSRVAPRSPGQRPQPVARRSVHQQPHAPRVDRLQAPEPAVPLRQVVALGVRIDRPALPSRAGLPVPPAPAADPLEPWRLPHHVVGAARRVVAPEPSPHRPDHRPVGGIGHRLGPGPGHQPALAPVPRRAGPAGQTDAQAGAPSPGRRCRRSAPPPPRGRSAGPRPGSGPPRAGGAVRRSPRPAASRRSPSRASTRSSGPEPVTVTRLPAGSTVTRQPWRSGRIQRKKPPSRSARSSRGTAGPTSSTRRSRLGEGGEPSGEAAASPGSQQAPAAVRIAIRAASRTAGTSEVARRSAGAGRRRGEEVEAIIDSAIVYVAEHRKVGVRRSPRMVPSREAFSVPELRSLPGRQGSGRGFQCATSSSSSPGTRGPRFSARTRWPRRSTRLGTPARSIYATELAGIRNAIFVFIKRADLRHLLAARLAGNRSVLDVQDQVVFRRWISYGLLYDGFIFRNRRQLEDFGNRRRRVVCRTIYQHWDPRYGAHRAGRRRSPAGVPRHPALDQPVGADPGGRVRRP